MLSRASRAVSKTNLSRLGKIGEHLLGGVNRPVVPGQVPSTLGFPEEYQPVVEFVSVARDGEQTLGGNRFWHDPKFQDYISCNSKIAEQHLQDVLNGRVPTGDNVIPVTMGAEEEGGAGDQVGEVFFFSARGDRISKVRTLAPDRDVRPLTRGVYGNLLVPLSYADLENQFTDSAVLAAGPHLDGQGRIVVKLFDSQGDPEKLRVPMEIVASLRDQGYNVAVEIAMPVSADHAPAYYVERMVENARLAKSFGFEGTEYNSTCKDMAGEWGAERVGTIIPQVITALSSEGIICRHGIHAHDTGLAAEANASLIKSYKEAREQGHVVGPCTVDILQGTGIGDRKKGFTGFEETENALYKATGTRFAVSDAVRDMFVAQGDLWNDILARNSARIPTTSLMTDEQQRMWQVAGGARDSFPGAIERKGVDVALNISLKEAVELVGYALRKVAPYIGKPSGVTPGFERKQNTTLNFITNLMGSGLNYSQISTIVKSDTPLTDKQIAMITQKLGDEEIKFFRDNIMPAQPHEIFSKAIKEAGNNLPPASQIPDKVDKAKEKAAELLSSGLLRPSTPDAQTALSALAHPKIGNVRKEDIPEIIRNLQNDGIIFVGQPYGEETQWHVKAKQAAESLKAKGLLVDNGDAVAQNSVQNLINLLASGAIQTGVTKGLYLGAEEFHRRSKTPWVNREPLPYEYQGDREAYLRDLARASKGLHPEHDLTEEIRNLYFKGKVSNDKIVEYDQTLRKIERLQIENKVAEYIGQNADQAALAGKDNNSLRKCVGDICMSVRADVDHLLKSAGQVPLYSTEERTKIALSKFNKIIGREGEDSQLMTEAVEELDSGSVRTTVAGTITKMLVQPGQSVKEGDPLAVVSAMKMEIIIRAKFSGAVGQVNCRVNDAVDVNGKLCSFTPLARSVKIEGSNSNKQSATPEEIAFVKSSAISSLSENNSKLVEGFSQKLQDMQRFVSQAKAAPDPVIELTEDEKRGVSRQPIERSGLADFSMLDGFELFVDNRGVAAGKATQDYRDYLGKAARILTTKGDMTTPVVKNAAGGVVKMVRSHSVADVVGELVEQQKALRPGQRVLVERMYGFNSESDIFSDQAKAADVACTGATGEQLRAVGSKIGFRRMLDNVAKELNVPFIENYKGDRAKLEEYLGNLSSGKAVDPNLNIIFRKEFAEAKKVGNKILIKANAGGGGKGQRAFTFDSTKSEEENYMTYLTKVLEARQEAGKLWPDDTTETERMLAGSLKHLELQLFMNAEGGGMVAGIRDCTKQIDGQKDAEHSLKEGDLPQGVYRKIIDSGMKVAEYLAKTLDHKNVATFELLYNPMTGETAGCEINDRTQVEHIVTEYAELGGKLSIPVVNAVLSKDITNSPPHVVLGKAFGLLKGDLQPYLTEMLSEEAERTLHVRLTARRIGLEEGSAGSTPSTLKDKFMPAHLFPNLAKKHGVTTIMGGVGDGKSDSQFGTIVGGINAVKAALQELNTVMPVLTESFERDEAAGTNIPFVLYMLPHMFDKTGNINPKFAISTCNDLFKKINEGGVIVVDAEGKIDGNKFDMAVSSVMESTKNAGQVPVEYKPQNGSLVVSNQNTQDPKQETTHADKVRRSQVEVQPSSRSSGG